MSILIGIFCVIYVFVTVNAGVSSKPNLKSEAPPDGNECLAFMGGNCFQEFTSILDCIPNKSRTINSNCVDRTNAEMTDAICRDYRFSILIFHMNLVGNFNEALNCNEDFVKPNCDLQTGTYDLWMNGLRGIQDMLCSEDNKASLTYLIEKNFCWNPGRFLSCTEDKTGLIHITDLITKPLDSLECSRLMISVALCNAKAEGRTYDCKGVSKVLMDALTAFFTKSSCMSQITHELLTTYCEPIIRFHVVVSVVSTIASLCLIGVILLLVLRRYNIVSFNRRQRLYNEKDHVRMQTSFK